MDLYVVTHSNKIIPNEVCGYISRKINGCFPFMLRLWKTTLLCVIRVIFLFWGGDNEHLLLFITRKGKAIRFTFYISRILHGKIQRGIKGSSYDLAT